MPIWTGTSTTSGNSIQVIQYVRLKELSSNITPFLSLVQDNSAFELPALIYPRRVNATLAVACVDPLSSLFFFREPCRQSSLLLLHHLAGCSLFTMLFTIPVCFFP